MNRSSTIMIIPDENYYNKMDPLSKTSVIKSNKFVLPNPEDYFDDTSVQIDKFDRRFSKMILRGKNTYPGVELDSI